MNRTVAFFLSVFFPSSPPTPRCSSCIPKKEKKKNFRKRKFLMKSRNVHRGQFGGGFLIAIRKIQKKLWTASAQLDIDNPPTIMIVKTFLYLCIAPDCQNGCHGEVVMRLKNKFGKIAQSPENFGLLLLLSSAISPPFS